MKKMTSKHLAYVAAFTGALLITACGGSGAGKVGPTPVPVAQPMQIVPTNDFDVQVTQYWDYTSNIPEHYLVKVTDPSKITDFKAFAGMDYETAIALVATPTGNSGEWNVTLPRTVDSGNGLLMSFALANGDSLETGLTSFSFAKDGPVPVPSPLP